MRARSALVVFLGLFLPVSPVWGGRLVRQLEGVVNINSATPDQLQLLPGVGPAKVLRIVAYRQLHPFRTVEELARIKGIGRKSVRALRLHLAVSGPTSGQQVFRPPSDSADVYGEGAIPEMLRRPPPPAPVKKTFGALSRPNYNIPPLLRRLTPGPEQRQRRRTLSAMPRTANRPSSSRPSSNHSNSANSANHCPASSFLGSRFMNAA